MTAAQTPLTAQELADLTADARADLVIAGELICLVGAPAALGLTTPVWFTTAAHAAVFHPARDAGPHESVGRSACQPTGHRSLIWFCRVDPARGVENVLPMVLIRGADGLPTIATLAQADAEDVPGAHRLPTALLRKLAEGQAYQLTSGEVRCLDLQFGTRHMSDLLASLPASVHQDLTLSERFRTRAALPAGGIGAAIAWLVQHLPAGTETGAAGALAAHWQTIVAAIRQRVLP